MNNIRPRLRPARTALTAGLVLLLAAGCDRVSRTLDLTGTVAAVPPQPIGPARLRVTLPATGARATLAPVARNGDVTVWQTLDGITLSFRDGVLIATRGLGDDLMSADVGGTLAMLRGTGAPGHYPQLRSYLDGEDRTVFRSFQCRRDARPGAGPPRRITERCVSPRDETTNTYWLDQTGKITRSRQWVSPAIDYMETERLPRE
ncbi:MAG: YjbF family lipoprotein [Roseovarius sp.]|uniref:YjbF family lipoprotein n=1 Tax=Roseovarius sp. TaxID=1486281 RepID=UPI004059AD72